MSECHGCGAALCLQEGLLFIETSALKNENVYEAFQLSLEEIYRVVNEVTSEAMACPDCVVFDVLLIA